MKKIQNSFLFYANNTHISDHKDNFNPEYYEDFVAVVKESNGIQ